MSEYTCDCDVIHPEAVAEVTARRLPEESYDRVAMFFKVLGDGTRIRLIWALHQRELCVCDLAAVLGSTKSAVSHQLRILRQTNLVKCRREGKVVYYYLADDHVKGMLTAGLEHVHE